MPKKQKARLGRVGRVEREQRLNKIIKLTTLVIITLISVVVIAGLVIDTFITPKKVIATAFGEEITVADFEVRVRMRRGELINTINTYSTYYANVTDPSTQQQILNYVQQIQFQLDTPEYIGQQILDEMIGDIIIKREAEALGITVTDEEIIEVLNNTFGYYPNGVPTYTPAPTIVPTEAEGDEGGGDDGEVVEEIVPTAIPEPTSITEDEYIQALNDFLNAENNKAYGVTKDVIYKLIEAQLYTERFSEELSKGINNLEDQVWARHILVKEEETANTVLERLADGEDFEELALELSIDTTTATLGGDLGWFNDRAMVPEFSDAAFDAEVGDIVGPVESQYGFHIIEILGHEMRPMTADELDYQTNLLLSDLINENRVAAEESGDIFYAENWVRYVPEDPRSSLPSVAQ